MTYTRFAWAGPLKQAHAFKDALEAALGASRAGFWIVPEAGQPPAPEPDVRDETGAVVTPGGANVFGFVAAVPVNFVPPAPPVEVAPVTAKGTLYEGRITTLRLEPAAVTRIRVAADATAALTTERAAERVKRGV
jgi:hypothetical protein